MSALFLPKRAFLGENKFTISKFRKKKEAKLCKYGNLNAADFSVRGGLPGFRLVRFMVATIAEICATLLSFVKLRKTLLKTKRIRPTPSCRALISAKDSLLEILQSGARKGDRNSPSLPFRHSVSNVYIANPPSVRAAACVRAKLKNYRNGNAYCFGAVA